MFVTSQVWPDLCIYEGSGAHGILSFGCGNDDTSQTANICNIIKPSYSKTLQVWKSLVVERFEELNVDVDMTTMITPRRCFLI